MTQHDYNIANAVHASVRADINKALEATATNNAGSGAPNVTYAHQWWVDTTNGLLKQRNAANNAWNIIKRLDRDGALTTRAGTPYDNLIPAHIGELCLDTANKVLFVSTGVTNKSWVSVGPNKAALPTNYHDLRIEYTSATAITIKAGSRFRAETDDVDIIFESDQLVTLAANGAGGLDTGAEAADTWYYLYAISDDSGSMVSAILSKTNEAKTGTISTPAGYTKKRQLRFALRNDLNSDIIPFFYLDNGRIIYNVEFNSALTTGNKTRVLTNGNATTPTTLSLASYVPAISRYATLHQRDNIATVLIGETANAFNAQTGGNGAAANKISTRTDATQSVVYRSAGAPAITFEVYSYEVTEI